MPNSATVLQSRRRGQLSTARKDSIRARDNWTCRECNGYFPKNRLGKTKLQVHHDERFHTGGSHDDSNLYSICIDCHSLEHKAEQRRGWQPERPFQVTNTIAGARLTFLNGKSEFDSLTGNPASGGDSQAREQSSSAKEKKHMGATYGGGGTEKLPAGTYLAQVTDVKIVETADFKNPEKKVKKFLWSVDYRAKGQQEWQRYSIFSTTEFRPLASIKQPKFEPKIHKLCRAWGLPIPQSAEEAKAWDENDAIGKQFRIKVIFLESDNELIEQYLSLSGEAAPAQSAAPTPPPPPPPAAVDGDDDNWDE